MVYGHITHARFAVSQVTRERIRQIECKALRKMKQPMRQSALKDYQLTPEVELTDRRVGGGQRSG